MYTRFLTAVVACILVLAVRIGLSDRERSGERSLSDAHPTPSKHQSPSPRPTTACAPEASAVWRDRLTKLDDLRGRLGEGHSETVGESDTRSIEIAFESVALEGPTLDLVDCSEPPCVGVFRGISPAALRERLTEIPDLESVASRMVLSLNKRVAVGIWEEAPTSEAQKSGLDRMMSIVRSLGD